MAVPRIMLRVRLLLNNELPVLFKQQKPLNNLLGNKYVQVQVARCFRTNLSSSGTVLNSKSDKDDQHSSSSSSGSTSSSSDSDGTDSDSDSEDEVKVVYYKGLPRITVPLPSRKEKCSFTLKPVTNTVGDFLEMLRREDRGIDRAVCKSMDGTRIASSNTIETLLDEDFILVINDDSYNVNTPKQERLTGEEVQRLSDVKNLVNQLYQALHVDEHQRTKEKELVSQLETLQMELLPLEEKRAEIEQVAQKRSNWLAWAGLGLMSVQFGILARLTWWEYSWDIMEPVTYFVTYGTAMACYAYFVLTKEEYILNDVRDRQQLITIHKKAKKLGVDISQYNMIRAEMYKIERKLKKLRNPLKLHLPQNSPIQTDGAAITGTLPLQAAATNGITTGTSPLQSAATNGIATDKPPLQAATNKMATDSTKIADGTKPLNQQPAASPGKTVKEDKKPKE